MSTTQKKDSRIESKVIVRSYGGMPVKLNAVEDYGESIEVAGDDPDKTICFPTTDVYKFNDQFFTNLQIAYKSGDGDRLASLWGKAEKFRT